VTELPCGRDHDLEDCICGCDFCEIEDSHVCYEEGCRGGFFCPHHNLDDYGELYLDDDEF
jgi:hypothetical protein